MRAREFDITIQPDGQVELHIKGHKGGGCLAVAKFFEQIVGELKSKQLTNEFYEPEEQVRFNIDQRH